MAADGGRHGEAGRGLSPDAGPDLRAAVRDLCDQLCLAVDGRFDLHLETASPDEDAQKLSVLINFLLEQVRRHNKSMEKVQQELENRVERRSAQLNLVLEGSRDGVFLYHPSQELFDFSNRWYAMLGLTPRAGKDTGGDWFDRLDPMFVPTVRTALDSHLSGDSDYLEVEYRIRAGDGRYRWMLARGLVRRDDHGRPLLLAGTQTDVTDRRNLDPRTGYPNEHAYGEVIEDYRREGVPFCVMLIAVDNISSLTETLTHDDLRELRDTTMTRLRQALPDHAHLARLASGAVGVVFTTEDDEDGPARVGALADSLVAQFDQPVHLTAGGTQWTQLSIGYAHSTSVVRSSGRRATDVEGGGDVRSAARTALREAKRQGGAQAVPYTTSMNARITEELTVESEVRSALADDRVVPFFQPIVSLPDRRVVGYEALVRIREEAAGWLWPGLFIPVAERSDLITNLGDRVLNRALQTIAQSGDGDHSVSVNLAANQLMDRRLVEKVSGALDRFRIAPHRLRVEVTETALVGDLETATRALSVLRQMGVKVAIDDFGTGYSSLNYLRTLPIDIVKIDRSFVRDSADDDANRAILKLICDLAHTLKLDVVAEGIESDRDEEIVHTSGATLGQGFFYGRPVMFGDAPEPGRPVTTGRVG